MDFIFDFKGCKRFQDGQKIWDEFFTLWASDMDRAEKKVKLF